MAMPSALVNPSAQISTGAWLVTPPGGAPTVDGIRSATASIAPRWTALRGKGRAQGRRSPPKAAHVSARSPTSTEFHAKCTVARDHVVNPGTFHPWRASQPLAPRIPGAPSTPVASARASKKPCSEVCNAAHTSVAASQREPTPATRSQPSVTSTTTFQTK